MGRLEMTGCMLAVISLFPIACGSDDDGGSGGGTGATGGSGGSGGSTGGSAGASSGGSAGTSSGGSAGTSSGGSAGTSAGGTAGASGAAGGGGVAGGTAANPVSAACQTCAVANCGAQVTACLGNPDCNACVLQDYTAAGCDSNTQYAAVCTCAVTGGGPCHNECGAFC